MSQPQRIIARSARLFSEACYYSGALAHPALSGIGPSATQKICVQDVLLKRVFSVSIYFRSVSSLQDQTFLVLSSEHGAIYDFSATVPEDLLTPLRYWSYIRIRKRPPQLFQICRRVLRPILQTRPQYRAISHETLRSIVRHPQGE
jgi:hypothetical protein